MKDTELRARLLRLGMTPDMADRTTALIRDKVHPVAAVAEYKMRDHLAGMSMLEGMGLAGLDPEDAVAALDEYGYVVDGTSGLLKKVKKVAKKVVKTVGKAAAVVAPVLPVAAVVAGGVALATKSKGGGVDASMRSSKKTGKVPYTSMSPDQLAAEKARVAAEIARGKDVKQNSKNLANLDILISNAQAAAQPPAPAVPAISDVSSSVAPANAKRSKKVRIPKTVDKAAGAVAAEAVQNGYPADTAALMQAMMAQQGTNMTSPQAQGVLQDVAAQGVEPTTAGPSSLPSWAIPAAIAAFGLAIVLPRKSR